MRLDISPLSVQGSDRSYRFLALFLYTSRERNNEGSRTNEMIVVAEEKLNMHALCYAYAHVRSRRVA